MAGHFIRGLPMTSPTRLLFAGASLLLLIASPLAQAQGQRIILESGGQRQEGFVRIQSNINMFVPGPTGDGEDAQKLRDRARRMIYEMAARECDLLREVLAKDCRLESVNTNLNRQNNYNSQQPDGYTVNGSMSLQITLK
jgi:hypothetical protein